MGWKKGSGVGKRYKKVVKPIEFMPRGTRQGLGIFLTFLTSKI